MKQLIRKILKEETDLKQTLKKQIEDDGWENTSKLVGGLENLIKIIYDGNLKEYCKDRIKETILYQTEIQDPNNFEDAEEYADFCISTSFDMYYNEDYDDEDNDDDYDDYSESEKNLINDLYDELHYELYDELIGIYNDFKEDETDINESKKDINKHSDAIRSVIENVIMTEYSNVICGYNIKEIEDVFLVTFYFKDIEESELESLINELWQSKSAFDNLLNEFWEIIYDYTGIAVGVSYEVGEESWCNDIESLNESKEDKNINVIKTIYNTLILPGFCSYEVTFNEDDQEYEIRTKLNRKYYELENHSYSKLNDEFDFLQDSLNDMGIKCYIFTPYYVDDCKDEVKFLFENEEKDQLTLVKNLIHQLFDDVKSIEVIDANKNVHNNYKKPLIKVYFENDSEAKNEESNFDMKIYRTIYDYTGLAVFPYWKTDWADVADFYLVSIKNYENNNVVNESFVDSENDYEKYKNVISNLIYEYFDENEICGIELDPFRFEEDEVDSIRIKIIFKEQKDFRDFLKFRKQLKETIRTYIPLFNKVFVTPQIGFCPDNIKEIKENVNEVEKNLKVIREILKTISWDGLCDIWVEYNNEDKEYEIRSKYANTGNDFDIYFNELEFLESTLKSMGLRPYIFAPYFVENCEDEVEFLN